jgi:hypothetical protein
VTAKKTTPARARKTPARAQATTSRKKPAARKPAARKPAARKASAAAGAGAAVAASLAKSAGALLSTAGKTTGAWLGWALRQPDVQRGLSFGALCAALMLSSSAVKAEVERWPTYQLDRSTLSVVELPEELSASARRDLERLPLPVDPTPFDARLVPAVHACLADLPWVEAVDEVRLAQSGKLEFSLRARRPVARLGTGGQVITSDGAVIPATYAAASDDLPQLLHVPGAKRPVARRKAIEAAVAVLESLNGVLPLASVDVANLGGRRDPLASEISLATAEGTVIEWGRRPEDDRPHLDAETKLDNLQRFLDQGPGLGACERLSLRWDTITYVPRPAALEEEIARR